MDAAWAGRLPGPPSAATGSSLDLGDPQTDGPIRGGSGVTPGAMNRETLFWALVFSVPPGVGIVGFATFVLGSGAVDPLAIAAGAATTLAIFAVFALAVASGSADEERGDDGGT